jgi:hypothetical protein
VPEAERSYRVAEAMLADAIGEPVETVVRRSWPTEDFPEVVEKFLDRYQPDLVLLKVPTFWVAYESVPLRLERRLGWFGRHLGRARWTVAGTPSLAHNRVFRSVRAFAQYTIGGDTYFEPEEVSERMGRAIRAIVRRENCALGIDGPQGRIRIGGRKSARERAERRRLRLDAALRLLADELHVTYWCSHRPLRETRRYTVLGDDLHPDSEGHAEYGREEGELMVEAWRTQLAGVQPRASAEVVRR